MNKQTDQCWNKMQLSANGLYMWASSRMRPHVALWQRQQNVLSWSLPPLPYGGMMAQSSLRGGPMRSIKSRVSSVMCRIFTFCISSKCMMLLCPFNTGRWGSSVNNVGSSMLDLMGSSCSSSSSSGSSDRVSSSRLGWYKQEVVKQEVTNVITQLSHSSNRIILIVQDVLSCYKKVSLLERKSSR